MMIEYIALGIINIIANIIGIFIWTVIMGIPALVVYNLWEIAKAYEKKT